MMKASKWYICPQLKLLLILVTLLSKLIECNNSSNKDSRSPIIVRPSVMTRGSSEGPGRTYDKGIKDTLGVLENYYDGTDNWRRYGVANPKMKEFLQEGPNSEQSEADGRPDDVENAPAEPIDPEESAVAQTPVDYKLPDAVIPLTKNKVLPDPGKGKDFKDIVDKAPSPAKEGLSEDMSEDQTEVMSVSEDHGEGTEYEYTNGSEGFGPSDMGYEAISENLDPNMESYSYHDGGEEPEEKYGYSYRLESEPENADPGMSYLAADDNGYDNGQSYIYKDDDGESQTYPGYEREFVYGSDKDGEESIRYVSEHGSEPDFEERYISEEGKGEHPGTENVYIDETDPSGTEYEYIEEDADGSESTVGSGEEGGKPGKKGRRQRRRQKKPNFPKKWETFTDDEKQDWFDRHPRTKQLLDRLFDENKLTGRGPRRSRRGEEPEPLDRGPSLINRGGRRRGRRLEDEYDEPLAMLGGKRRGRGHRGDAIDDDLSLSRSGPRRRHRLERDEYSPGLKNGRRKGGYDLIQDIKGDPYLTTVGERVLSKYPTQKRDNILKLRNGVLRDIKRGRRPSGIYEDIIDPVDLMLIYRDANRMPQLAVRSEGEIPLEYKLKLPKGLYRWEELDPRERAKLKKKWREEIVNGTFWDDDNLHGDWSDEVRLLGEWGEEEALKGIMGRETRPGGQMGEYSYYNFEPKFTDLRNKGVFSGEYPEDIEHLILVGDMLPENKLEGEFRVPEIQLLRFHPRFGHLEELDDDFALENVQSRRNEGSFYSPRHHPSWMEYRTRGSFGKGIPENKYSWLESVDRDDALKLIEEANYGDPDFNDKLIIKYPWLKDRVGESVYSDDGLVLPIQVLNEFIPNSVYGVAKEDERYPGSKWYFSEVPSDQNLDRFITDIYKHMKPSHMYISHKRSPYLDAAMGISFGEGYNLDGWDRETVNYLRELFRDAENREIELQEELDRLNGVNQRGPAFLRNGRRRKHRLKSSRPGLPIWYFGTEEQRDRERKLEFAIESDSTGGIIEGKPSNRVFLDSMGRRPEGVLGLELQDISDNPGYDVESLGVSDMDYLDADDDEDLNLAMMGSYHSSKASPIRIKNIYSDGGPGVKYFNADTGIYPVDRFGRPYKAHRGGSFNFNPIRRYVFNDDDIDMNSPLSISQSDFLQESSGFNVDNPFIIGKGLGMNRGHISWPGRPGRVRRGKLGAAKRYPAFHKVNEFGQEDPMEIIRDYYDLNENSILDVLDGKGIYRPRKKKVGYGVGDLDYLRRSNDDDWNYMKKLKGEGRASGPKRKRKDKPLWYYYDSIGRRWDDSLEDEGDLMDSSIDLIVKELQSKKGNKNGKKVKGARSRRAGQVARKGRPGHNKDEDGDYSLLEVEDLRGKGKHKGRKRGSGKRKGGVKPKKRKGKKVRFNLHPGNDASEASSEISADISEKGSEQSQSEPSSLDKDSESSETSGSAVQEDEDEDFELGPLAKRILVAAGYDDDLDPNVPLSIETEILDLLDTGKRGRGRKKQKKGSSSASNDVDNPLDLNKMRDTKKINLDKHDLSEIRRMRRDLDDESGDLEALKALIRKLHLDELVDLNNDPSSKESQYSDSVPSELEKSENESSTSASDSSEEASEGNPSPGEEVEKKSGSKPLKVVKIKRSKNSPNGDSEEASASTSASSDDSSSVDTSQVEEEEFDLSEWDDFINDEIKNLDSKSAKSKSGRKNGSRKKRDSRLKKGLKKSKEEKEALLNLGIDPKVVKRVNLLLKNKEYGVMNALDYLLDELENNLDDSPPESRSRGKKSKRRRRNNRRGNNYRKPYDLEPVTPPFSRYILKLKDVLGPKEALEELLDNLGIDLSGEEPVPKELRRYVTPAVINEVRVLRNKKDGDERALNKLLNVLKIPNKHVSGSRGPKNSNGSPTKRGSRRLPALLNEEDIKAVNRLLKRNKAPQALEYFLKGTGLDTDLEDNNKGVYRPRASYSGFNLSPERLSRVKYLMDQGPQGCRDALSEIFDDLGIPKRRSLFDRSLSSLEEMDPQNKRRARRNRQRRMAVLPDQRGLESEYLDGEDRLDEDMDDELSQFDDFSTFIPREYYRMNREGSRLVDPRRMLPFGGSGGASDPYRVSPVSMLTSPYEDSQHRVFMGNPILRSGMVPSIRYYKAPEMSKYDRDLRNYVNARRKGFGMPNIPDYQYWNYDPEITGRPTYEGLDTPTNRRRRQILERKRKLSNYLDEEHDVSVPLVDGDESGLGKADRSKTIMMRSYVDDDLPESSEEVMLVNKPEYSEEELYDMGQCLANDASANKLNLVNGSESNSQPIEAGDLQSISGGFDVEREGTREEILSTLVTDPRVDISNKLILKEISDNDDTVASKIRNMVVENPMMERSRITGPVDSVEKLKEAQTQNPESAQVKGFGYLDPSLSSYDRKLYSDSFVESLERGDFETAPVSVPSQMLEECRDIASQLKMKNLGCERITDGDASESRRRPLDVRTFSKRASKVKNLYAKSFLKQISFSGEVAKLYVERFSDLKGWNKAMDRHRWVALPLVSPQSYVPNLGGLNLFQRMVLHQAVKKQKRHYPRRVLILAFSTRSVTEKKLPDSLANLGEFSARKNSISSVEYSMNVEYSQGMLVIPLIELALCVKGSLQLNNVLVTSKSKKTKLGTCIVGGVRSHTAAQKIYRAALKYLEMSPDLSMAKFLIIPIRVGRENLSEQLKLSDSGNIEKNFGLQIPEDAISPAVSDLEFSKFQFEMKFENSKQVKERYNKKLASLSEALFKLYLMNSRELDIRSLKANGPRSVVVPMAFPQLYIKGYSRAQKLVKSIQDKYKPSLKNRSYRNKLKPGFILLVNDQTVGSGSNSKQFINEQIKRIQSFFTNPYSFKNFKARKHEGPVLEIKGVNSLQLRKFLLDAIARASRQPSVSPMIILPIFVDDNSRTSKSDKKAMKKASKRNAKHSANI